MSFKRPKGLMKPLNEREMSNYVCKGQNNLWINVGERPAITINWVTLRFQEGWWLTLSESRWLYEGDGFYLVVNLQVWHYIAHQWTQFLSHTLDLRPPFTSLTKFSSFWRRWNIVGITQFLILWSISPTRVAFSYT